MTSAEEPSAADDPTASDALRITVTDDGGRVVLTVAGEIDLVTTPKFGTALTTALAAEPGAVVADLSAVTFLGSAGLSALVSAHITAGERTRFAVVAATRKTRRPLQLTGLDGKLTVFSSLDAAQSET